MRIRMVTESDVIFGSGMADAGLVDTEVQVDEEGFPYYKGGTFKGVFREALELYLSWTGGAKSTAERILGKPGSDEVCVYKVGSPHVHVICDILDWDGQCHFKHGFLQFIISSHQNPQTI